jgi:glycosyltransferase A (GT-A) superfamily protein (DUF2064 family)
MARRHLVIFARFPTAGAGKRRLASGIGTVRAVAFQRVRLAALLADLGRDTRWRTWLAVTPHGSGPWFGGYDRLSQGRGHLGKRLSRVFTVLPPGPVVVVGSDIPEIQARDVADAFRCLGAKDAVFGPCPDGGYWLIGLRRKPRSRLPFHKVRWSSPHAREDTERELGDAKIGQLRLLEDVDHQDALLRHPRWNRRVTRHT